MVTFYMAVIPPSRGTAASAQVALKGMFSAVEPAVSPAATHSAGPTVKEPTSPYTPRPGVAVPIDDLYLQSRRGIHLHATVVV